MSYNYFQVPTSIFSCYKIVYKHKFNVVAISKKNKLHPNYSLTQDNSRVLFYAIARVLDIV